MSTKSCANWHGEPSMAKNSSPSRAAKNAAFHGEKPRSEISSSFDFSSAAPSSNKSSSSPKPLSSSSSMERASHGEDCVGASKLNPGLLFDCCFVVVYCCLLLLFVVVCDPNHQELECQRSAPHSAAKYRVLGEKPWRPP